MNNTQSIPKPVPMHGISRLKSKTGSGWLVRIKYLGREERRFFGDVGSKGEQNGLKAAQEYRDSLIAILPAWRQVAASKFRANSSVKTTP